MPYNDTNEDSQVNGSRTVLGSRKKKKKEAEAAPQQRSWTSKNKAGTTFSGTGAAPAGAKPQRDVTKMANSILGLNMFGKDSSGNPTINRKAMKRWGARGTGGN